jgi:tetratricopeptide (TPR) repeat protein
LAIGPALSLFAAGLFLSADRCEFFVRGNPEPQTELLQLVDRYRGGVSAADLTRLPVAESDALIQRVDEVRKLIDLKAELTAEPDDSCFQAASLLETEHAMALASESRSEEADAHFAGAWRISHFLEAKETRLHFQRDWLLAAGLFYHQMIFAYAGDEGGFERADRFLQNAVKRFPDDAEVLLAAGSLLEWAGSLRLGESAHLKEAEELYARARHAAPSDPVLLLRHGRVLSKLGDTSEARTLLLRSLELPTSPDVLYRCRMTLGGMAEGEGELADALAHYEAAVNLIGEWQVAHVALAHTLHLTGGHDRAREILDAALAIDIEEADEVHGGWWSYELGISTRFGPLLNRMRAEVRQ